MSSSGRGLVDEKSQFARQAKILKKNLEEWDRRIRTPGGEDWPTMLGRLNAALNQTANMDRSVDDVLEHFVYLPKKSPAQPEDIPFFLNTGLATTNETLSGDKESEQEDTESSAGPRKQSGDPVQQLSKFESSAARLAEEYESKMVRF